MNIAQSIHPSEDTATPDIQSEARQLCHDASRYFNYSHTDMQSISREKLAALQLAGLQFRFDTLHSAVPMLEKLADKQGIGTIETVDDAVPLLFEHTMYKSYPPSLLENNQFSDITRWMNKLVAIDLSGVDVSGCQSIDEWIEILDRETPLMLTHSSGTSGTMSFLPCSKREWEKFGDGQKVQFMQRFGEPHDPDADDEDIYAIHPYFRSGAIQGLRNNDVIIQSVVGSEDRLFTAYPMHLSSDLLHLAAKVRAAQARGELDRLKINPSLLERRKEYERLQADMPEHLGRFFEDVAKKLAGKRVIISATLPFVHTMSVAGLEKGLRKIFTPNSIICTGGGAKGVVLPDSWEEDILNFTGVRQICHFYGMAEVQGCHLKCEYGHYHFVPWVIPFLLDSETSKVLPRKGTVTGRASFFDLSCETRWGGFISGDEITVNWDDPCPCGRTSAYTIGEIQRYSDKTGGDDKINCAATENAHKEAMSFLTTFE
jgi:hypothetical protein